MSFLSDLGAIIGEGKSIVDDVKQTFQDSAGELVQTGKDLTENVTSLQTGATDQLQHLKDSVSNTIEGK